MDQLAPIADVGHSDAAGTAYGRLVAFTGTDGAGKSAQAGLLARRLNRHGRQTYVSEGKDDFTTEILQRWCGATEYLGPRKALGNEVMDIVKAVDVLRDLGRNVLPLRAVGIDVVAPRSIYCRLALARAFGSGELARLESLLSMMGEPELTIFLDVPLATTMSRIDERGFDDEDPELMTAFARELRALAPEKGFVVLDGDRPRQEVHHDVWLAYQRRFGDLPDDVG